ncbi:MAG: type II toxin-antitoxin system VapC family toxin [Deltaproteobacteria bacterium]|nr:type II toxin-antitoxin system VapC family toxin [Deltaproteobacteria bacterium]
MNYLLDTHVILWCAATPERISPSILKLIEDRANELWFSPISVWEVLILMEKGRVVLRPAGELGVRKLFQGLPLKEAVLNQEVAILSRRMDLPHQDPADRFLAATAAVYGFTLITADRRLLKSRAFSVLPAV